MISSRGYFVVIEGADGSGKATQTDLLNQRLSKNGYVIETYAEIKNKQLTLLENNLEWRGFSVKIDDYPRYQTSAWGKLVGRMLMGEFGDPMKISPYLTALPYMIDEYFGSKNIKRLVNKGYFVISNRYFTSNVHQVAKLKGEEKIKFEKWLWDIGWNELKIYKPDLVIVLLVPPKISAELIIKKSERKYTNGEKEDFAEKCYEHQLATYEGYIEMCKKNKNWIAIDCCDKNEHLLKPEEIHKKILEILSNLRMI